MPNSVYCMYCVLSFNYVRARRDTRSVFSSRERPLVQYQSRTQVGRLSVTVRLHVQSNPQKVSRRLLSISSPNIDRYSNLFLPFSHSVENL